MSTSFIKKQEYSSDQRKTLYSKTIYLKRSISALSKGLSFLPITLTLITLSYATRARIYLGYWPKPFNPTQNELPFETHYLILILFLQLVWWSFPLWLLLKILCKLLKIKNRYHTILFTKSWILIIAMFYLPPIDFLCWIMD